MKTQDYKGQVVLPALPMRVLGLKIVYLSERDIDPDKSNITIRNARDYEGSDFLSDFQVAIEENKQNKSNEMVIKFSEKKVKEISDFVVKVRDNDNQEMERALLSKISGRLVGIQHITKDCSINSEQQTTTNGFDGYCRLIDSGERMLVGWDKNMIDVKSKGDRKIILAYKIQGTDIYGYENAIRDGSGNVPKIMARKILDDWPEMTSWKTMPRYEETPTAEFAFIPMQNDWRLFDVTPFIKASDVPDQPFYGVMFSFDKEFINGQRTGYQFFSREATNSRERPMLLIVESDETVAE